MKRSIAKQIFGERKYRKDLRNEGHESSKNMRKWVAKTYGCTQQYDAFLTANSTGAEYGDLGDLQSANIKDQQVSPSVINFPMNFDEGYDVRQHQRWEFYKHRVCLKFTNIGIHPVKLQLWEYNCNATLPTSSSSVNCGQSLMNVIEDGIDHYLSTGDTGDSEKKGKAMMAGRSGNEMETYSEWIRPYNQHISEKWKLCKHRKVRLNPGDEVIYKIYLKDFTYDKTKYMPETVTTQEQQIHNVAGITKGLVIDFQGPIGRSDAAGGHSTVGIVNADLAITETEELKFVPLFGAKRYRHLELQHDDLETVTVNLQHPTDMALATDAS